MSGTNIGEHFDETGEITLDAVKKRAVRGIATLVGRTFFLQLVSFGGGFLVTFFLLPDQFGTWIAVQAFLGFFSIFQDVGLAAALIQKKETPSRKALETTFAVQNLLVICLVSIIFLATPIYRQLAHLDQQSVYLAWALAINFLLSSLMSIPSLLLERKLEFNKLVIPGIVGTILYQFVVVFLAWKGFGITSYTVAVLVNGFSSLILMYIVSPWRPGLAFDRQSLRELLRFGVPYQVNQILAKIKDDGVMMVLAVILGPAGIGFLGWARKWPQQLLSLAMDPVTRVTFPAFSRMQSHPEELSRALSKSIFFICLLMFPSLAILVLFSPILIDLIPRYIKWQPGLLALGLVSINAAWATVSSPLTNALNATGRIKTTSYLMIMWLVLTWIFIPVLALFFGINGAAAGYALVGTSSFVAVIVTLRVIKFDLLGSVGKPLLGSVIMSGAILLGKQLIPVSWIGIVILSIVSFTVYAVSMFILVGPSLITDAKKFVQNVKGGN